jgi:hypothetical protein
MPLEILQEEAGGELADCDSEWAGGNVGQKHLITPPALHQVSGKISDRKYSRET